LRVDESPLTGESTPVAPEREVFAGTYVTDGAGEALVTATGMDTRFGHIAALTQGTKRERSPLELELARVSGWWRCSRSRSAGRFSWSPGCWGPWT
jgi:cation transport ATPase